MYDVPGNDVIFLDPHTTQSIGVVGGKEHEHEKKMDSSYHCSQASRLHIMQMDPSVAVVSASSIVQIFTLYQKFNYVCVCNETSKS